MKQLWVQSLDGGCQRALAASAMAVALSGCHVAGRDYLRALYRGTVVAGPLATHTFERKDPPKKARRIRLVRVNAAFPKVEECTLVPTGDAWTGEVTDPTGYYEIQVGGELFDRVADICFGAEGYEYYSLRVRPGDWCAPSAPKAPCYLNVVLKRREPRKSSFAPMDSKSAR